ncbi:S-adenosyl-L-methionine-dependent methyltransferase [Trichoderma evansii]
MEDNAVPNNTTQILEDEICWRTDASRIHDWRATVLNFDSDSPASPPTYTYHRLLPFEVAETPLSSNKAIPGHTEPSQLLSRSGSSPSFCSTIEDSEPTDPLSTSPSWNGHQLHSTEKSPSPTLLSVDIPEFILPAPKSSYEGFEPPDGMSIMSELRALQTLSPYLDGSRADKCAHDFTEILLDDFSIYLDSNDYPEEMRSLHHLNTKIRHSSFFFDGILSFDNKRVYVRRIQIAAVPIGNYGSLSKHTVRGNIWLQSQLGSKQALFYKLGIPAREYRRFFYPFLWVADLAKHFVDFLFIMAKNGRKVSIHHFRSTFAAWLKKSHMDSPEFLEWLSQHPSDDYRTSVVANIKFLYKETIGVLGYLKASFHTIWAEILDFQLFRSLPLVVDPPTIVTQYIYACFEHLPFGDRLKVIPLSLKTTTLRNELIGQRHLEYPSNLHQTIKDLLVPSQERIKNIKPGDTISTHRDDVASGTLWERELSKGFSDVDRWFALVQSVHVDRYGLRTFDVIWYYRPVDTLCGLMKYPWNNELFLSDHCSCSETSKIDESEILGVHDVEFWGTSTTKAEFFCRQTYLQEERRWITLKESHLWCEHTSVQPKTTTTPTYQPGQTYLLHIDLKTAVSEPCEFITSFRESGAMVYRFRRLLRRTQVDPNAPNARPNELVYSDQTIKVKKSQILSSCSVRFFQDGDTIPTPYDRDGTGNLFYITHQQVFIDGASFYIPLKIAPASLHQGHDPLQTIEKLRGIDLFCGGGNFGRGLEDGGGIQMKWANDYDSKAIHTYMANVKNPEDVHPFLGSIDDLQRLSMQGEFARNVPQIGDVDFVSGGSPCPGFSSLTNDKTTAAQRKNQSLVAAFASFVDLYRPKYGVLENVPGMVNKKTARDQDVFSQLICALVGLGYQTQFFHLDASSCGSSQRRPRIFIVFAAPGLELPKRPVQTHSHPPATRELGIGYLPNGQHMTTREMPKATPFKYVSAEEAASDLPSIYDAQPDICVPYPDHRVTRGFTRTQRARISSIPTQPWGMNFSQAWYGEGRAKVQAGEGTMTAAERDIFSTASHTSSKQPMNTLPASKAYGRMFPNKLFETIVTSAQPTDAKNGRVLHWRENRLITVMEARRAQGFRDEEVLLGDPHTQYKIVGNSVARQVAVVLGVTFREAWVTSLERNKNLKVSSHHVAEEADDMDAIYGPIVSDIMSSSQSGTFSPITTHTTVSRGSSPLASVVSIRDGGYGVIQQTELASSYKRAHSGALVVEIPQFLKRRKSGGGD